MPSPVIHTLADLIRIKSVNPAYEGGAPEAHIAAFIREFFCSRGIECYEQEVFPGRPNLIARVLGRQPARRVIFEAHVDTASASGMDIPPFEPEIRDGCVYGRGACDTKAGLAAMMHALAALHQMPPCEIWVVAAADEEFSYRGVVRLCEGLTANAAVVSEPTEMRLVVATKGCVRFRILARGIAAHSSKPESGRNAIVTMARVVGALEGHTAALAKMTHPLLGHATYNIGTIHGGKQVNIVPDACAIEIDRRLLPGEEIDAVLAEYEAVLADLRREDPDLQVEMESPMLSDYPLETAAEEPVVVVAGQVLQQLGLPGSPAGVPYGSDASKLSRAGIPSIVIGPGSIDQAHAAVEFVDCRQVDQAFEFYRGFMETFE
jgi:acetylornithine deacetylase